jgi:hypothetical protein
MSAALYNCCNVKGIYGYYSLIVHLMGKRIDASTRGAITTRRPQNLIDRFKCPQVSYILTGDGKMSSKAHEEVTQAWLESTTVRRVAIEEFSTLSTADTSGAEMVALMFGMLENSGMQPIAFIHNLLLSCDWVISEMPALSPAYHLYIQSVEAYDRSPAHMRPFLKLYWSDSTKIFHGKSLANLTACAVLWMLPDNPTMSGYTIAGSDRIKADFIAKARAHGIDLAQSSMVAPAPPTI